MRKAPGAPCSSGSFSSDRIVILWCGLRLPQSSFGFSSTGAELFGFLVLILRCCRQERKDGSAVVEGVSTVL